MYEYWARRPFKSSARERFGKTGARRFCTDARRGRWLPEACGRDNWAHTSAILGLIANVNREPKKTRAFKPADFDPYSVRERRDGAIEVTDMAVLKDAFARR